MSPPHGGWGRTRHKKSNFCGHPDARHYANNLCRDCYRNTPEFRAMRQRYYQNHKAQWQRETERTKREKRKQQSLYGITKEQWEALYTAQGGLCALCGRQPGKKGLAVDHCHRRGHFRSLLCGRCNMGLGAFSDNPELLRRAADYLDRHNSLSTATSTARAS